MKTAQNLLEKWKKGEADAETTFTVLQLLLGQFTDKAGRCEGEPKLLSAQKDMESMHQIISSAMPLVPQLVSIESELEMPECKVQQLLNQVSHAKFPDWIDENLREKIRQKEVVLNFGAMQETSSINKDSSSEKKQSTIKWKFWEKKLKPGASKLPTVTPPLQGRVASSLPISSKIDNVTKKGAFMKGGPILSGFLRRFNEPNVLT